MLTLDTKITLNKDTLDDPNIATRFSNEDRRRIGGFIYEGYRRDKASRFRWETRTEAAMDLAMQLQQAKSFPWPGCANVAFPLVTIATMQFHSRAYPTIINSNTPAMCRTLGQDKDGKKTERAERIGAHMSWQVMEQDASWEEQQDRLLIQLPIIGTVFKKSRFDDTANHNTSCAVAAYDLVVNYWAKSIEAAQRKTHVIQLDRNDIYERCVRGTFIDVRDEAWFKQPPAPQITTEQRRADTRKGTTIPMSDELTPYTYLEQHVSLDLDGDGYAEPYIATVEQQSRCLCRLVTRVDREADIDRIGKQIAYIRPTEYFTKYGFIPSPDGGIYDVGFGVLLGPLNESVNSIINQLLDAGTMATTAGGFLGRGAKIRGGVYQFAPFGWQRVDSSGEDLSKSIYPFPVREPSATLFQLLSFLVNYTNRISGSTDMLVGENPGQNTPAQTAQEMVTQGTKIYSAIFKRVWRSFKGELKKLYVLNGIYMPEKQTFGVDGFATKEDYLGNPDDVCPAADPNITSDKELLQQAVALKQSAAVTPGYNKDAVEKRYLKALKVSAPDEVFSGTQGLPPPESEKVTLKKMDLQFETQKLQLEQMKFSAELQEQVRLNNAEIIELQAKAMKEVASIEGDEKDRQINAVNAMVGVLKHKNEALLRRIEVILDATRMKHEQRVDEAEIPGVASRPGNDTSPAALGSGTVAGQEGAMV